MTVMATRFATFWVVGLVGISLGSRSSAAAAGAASFHRDVEPILQRHCQDCHRPGQVAPFSLLSYDQVRKRAEDIAGVTEERSMPPWHASTTEGGPFRGARVLSQNEIATLAAWAKAGCPEGSREDAPPPKRWASDWVLGTPDLVLKVPEAYAIGGSGSDEHRVFVIPSGLLEGRWISAVDFKPGNPQVVHHVLSAFDTTGRARKLDEADPKPGYKTFVGYGRLPNGLPFLPSGQLGGWAPGKSPRPLPSGVGRYLPAHSDVLLQVHYHKSGKPETDASQIGLYFAKTAIQKQLKGGMVIPPRPGLLSRPELRIPAGDANYVVKGSWTVRYDAHLLAVVPHMHWLGKDFLLQAVLPDGARQTLLKVDRWDFNWQDTYDFTTPVALPRGSRVEMVAHFDNSAANSRNPSRPPIEVHWGEQTTDEMCIGFLQLTRDDEHLDNRPPATGAPNRVTSASGRRE
jgi:hypothetical protein